MKKKIILLFCLLSMLPIGVFAGCSGEDENKNKTQLNVEFYNGGYGSEWLDELASRFEEAEKQNSYEPGKMGVHIRKIPGGINEASLTSGYTEVFFHQQVVNLHDYISKGLLLDISDIVTEKLTAYGETRSIEQKMTDGQQEYLKVSSAGTEKYYAVPHYTNFDGIVYDVALFEKELLYFKDGGGFVSHASDTRSAGPDGKKGTSDDGLPATYDQFFMLCDYIVSKGHTPFTWNGTYRDWYLENFLTGLAADHEGAEQMSLNYTFSGQATNLISGFDAQGVPQIRPPVTIENSNGYELYAQAGRYYALDFMNRVIQNESYYDPGLSFSARYSHTEAQNDFLYSSFLGNRSSIAMLIEGIYWENEAYEMGTFDAMARRYDGAGRMDRRFGFLPFPKATEEEVFEGNRITLIDTFDTYAYISAKTNPDKIDLAKKFLQFACSDQSLIEFTVTTNTPKALKYTMTPTDKARLSNYGKSIMQMVESDRVDIIYSNSANPMLLDNMGMFRLEKYYSKIGDTTRTQPIGALRNDKINPMVFFNGYKAYQQSTWSKLQRYF